MEIIKEVNDVNELYDMCWSGAVDTLDAIIEADKENELMWLLEEMFFDHTPTETEMNDVLWFESDWIYEHLGLDKNGEIPEEVERIDEADIDWSKYETFDDFCNDMDCDTCPFGDVVNSCEDLFEDYKSEN